MDSAKQHWPILRRLKNGLSNRVREFMVIGYGGCGLLVATEDGQGFWFGKMRFENDRSKSTNKPLPLNVPGHLVQMAQCHSHILLLNKLGEIYSMGLNESGQLGLGTINKKTYFWPQLIPCSHKFTSVRCGSGHSLALTDDGKCFSWGLNGSRQVGMPNTTYCQPSPHQISELDSHRIVAVECGGAHSLVLTDQGEVYAWGENRGGELGDGEEEPYKEHNPTRIVTPCPIKSIAAGTSETLLLTHSGELWVCGRNDFGQLGLPENVKFTSVLTRVPGLSPITKISAHHDNFLTVALTSYNRCFVFGHLKDYTNIFIPQKMPSFYSTLTFHSIHRNTEHSLSIPEIAHPISRLSTRMSRMFDNTETNSDVQFVVEQRTINAHRCILSNSSDYFARMFSERWLAPVDPEDPIVRVTITDHSYEALYSFLRFFYIDTLEVHSELLPELFELASHYLVPELQEICLLQMRDTVTPDTFCLYYQLTNRHSALPELEDFQEDLVQFASTRMSEITPTAAYKSMESDLRDQLINAASNFKQI